MRKKVYICSILLIFLLTLSTALTIPCTEDHEISRLIEVAKKLEGDILGYSIHGHTKANDIKLGQISTILDEMGYEGEVDDDIMFYDWFYEGSYYKLEVTEGEEKYLSLSIDFDNEKNPLLQYNKIKESLEKINGNVHITTSIFKELDGNLGNTGVVEQVYNGFKLLSANLVTDYDDGKSFAFLGYSPYLVNSIEIDDKLYNLHMAVHFDDWSNTYHLVIANPIIETSY